jgi:hypothetical protein
MDTERFNVKRKGGGVKTIRLQSETRLQLWKTYRTVGSSIGHGAVLERTAFFGLDVSGLL